MTAIDPVDVAESIIAQLRIDDGPGCVSVMQLSNSQGRYRAMTVATPVVVDGVTRFDFRAGVYEPPGRTTSKHLKDSDGFNMPDADSAAWLMAEYAQRHSNDPAKCAVCFMHTGRPVVLNRPVFVLDLSEGHAKLTGMLELAAKMRPVQGRNPLPDEGPN